MKRSLKLSAVLVSLTACPASLTESKTDAASEMLGAARDFYDRQDQP
jgi:hypothetical protein